MTVGSRRPVAFVGLGAVLLLQVFAAFQRRWMQEDGFINVRIAQQVLAGHGPVFNVGERVEAFTSPLWLGLLVVLRIVTFGLVPYEWLAVVSGLVLSTAGTAAMFVGAVALWTPARARADSAWWLPVGVLVPLALPPFWDFATSGLETSMSWAWIGGAFAAVATAERAGRRHDDDAPPTGLSWRYLLIGVGPLVRPELLIYSVSLGAALLVLVDRPAAARRHEPVRWLRALGLWAGVPLAYQVFRMGYYATLVPNTAIAKGAGTSVWDRGVVYLGNFAGTYRLAVPLVIVVVLCALRPWRGKQVWVAASVVAPAALHGLYVVWVGGDYMHGRFWLVPVLAMVAPVAALPVRPLPAGRRLGVEQLGPPVAAALLTVWALVAASQWRPPATQDHAIDDQRALVVTFTGHAHPVMLADQPQPLLAAGRLLRDRDGADEFVDVPGLLDLGAARTYPRPTGSGTAGHYDAIGVAGVAAGPDVWFVDPFGLADPVAARLPVETQLRAGHTHQLPEAWRLARAGVTGVDDRADVAAAKRAMTCGPGKRLLRDVRAPMSPGRFLGNLVDSFANTRLEVPADPAEAVRRWCTDGPPG